MNHHSHHALWLSALVTTYAAFTAHAQAQDCAEDADCGAGYQCKTSTYTSCWGGGMDVAGTGGSAGAGVEGDVTCEEVSSTYCASATCLTDADCPSTMACAAQTEWQCDGSVGGTGAAGSGGDAAGSVSIDGECHAVPTDSLCIPRYQLPCQTASDCGGGFDCVESFYTMCSGGGSAGIGGTGGTGSAMPPGAAGSGEDVTCEEVSSGQSYCQLQVLPCASDSECPDGLECAEYYAYLPCDYAGGTAGTTGVMGAAGAGAVDCPEPTVELRCQVPYTGGGTAGSGGGTAGGMAGGTAGTEATSGGAGTGNPAGEDDEDSENDEGSAGKGNGGGHGRGPKHLLGCSTTGPVSGESSSSALLMLALGAVAFVRRARRR